MNLIKIFLIITYFIYPVYTGIYWCEILFFLQKLQNIIWYTLHTLCCRHYLLHATDIIFCRIQTYTLQTLFLTPCRRTRCRHYFLHPADVTPYRHYLIHPADVMLQTLFTTCYRHYFLQNTDVHPADVISDTLQTYTLQTLFLTPCRRYTLQTLFVTLCRRYTLQTLFVTPCRHYSPLHPADVFFPADITPCRHYTLQTFTPCRQSPCRPFSTDDPHCPCRRKITSVK